MSEQEEQLHRVTVPELDAVLGRRFQVLDDGFVRVVDYMGGDASIVQAARVSYGAGTKAVHEDAGLVRYLMRHRHTTPFEMCEIKLHVRAPMDAWRQWIRHRTANVNEYSTRYSIAIDSAARTEPGSWRTQSTTSKQGSADRLPTEVGTLLSKREEELQRAAREVYEERIAKGVAREQARKDLPLSTYTEAYWKIDLHNLFHFLALRMDAHAQEEIRAYAAVIGEQIVAKWCPIAWAAFNDYAFNAINLSAREIAIVRALAQHGNDEALKLAVSYGWLDAPDAKPRANRERREADEKLRSLGLTPPWSEDP